MQRQSASWIVCLSLCSALLACSKDEAPPASEPAAAQPSTPVAAREPVESEQKSDAAASEGALPTQEPKAEEPASVPATEVAAAESAGDKPVADQAPAGEGDGKSAGAKKSDKKKSGDKAAEEPAKETKPKFTELGVQVTKTGTGTAAGTGRQVTIHYRASLPDAEKPFDSTFSSNRPLEVQLGPDAKLKVIEGLRRGLEGLTPGSEVRLEIPASLAWGEKGNPAVGVPANSDVIFEVHVLDVQ